VPRRWRLLLDGPAPGPWNMGVDEALLASAAAGGSPTLRLYAWEGPWLSLGYAQRFPAAGRAACARAGVGVVRRATGGRAVLHGVDLTYAVAAPEALLPSGVRPTYELLAGALRTALRGLGVEAERQAPRPAADPAADFDCFAEPAEDELCVDGRKLVGSAQRRAGRGALQHCSIRLAADPQAARRATGLSGRGATSLAELGRSRAEERLRELLVAAFAASLDADFDAEPLAPEELAQARRRGENPTRVTPPPPPGDPQGGHRPADT
jgi:lipoate-protein ligase A